MLQAYRDHIAERELEGIPPKPLDAQQVTELVALIKARPRMPPILVAGFSHDCSYAREVTRPAVA